MLPIKHLLENLRQNKDREIRLAISELKVLDIEIRLEDLDNRYNNLAISYKKLLEDIFSHFIELNNQIKNITKSEISTKEELGKLEEKRLKFIKAIKIVGNSLDINENLKNNIE